MSTEARIRGIISENVEGFDGAQLKATAAFFDSGLDSLDLATVLLEVQEEFGVEIPEGDEDKFDTLQKLVDFVDANLGE